MRMHSCDTEQTHHFWTHPTPWRKQRAEEPLCKGKNRCGEKQKHRDIRILLLTLRRCVFQINTVKVLNVWLSLYVLGVSSFDVVMFWMKKLLGLLTSSLSVVPYVAQFEPRRMHANRHFFHTIRTVQFFDCNWHSATTLHMFCWYFSDDFTPQFSVNIDASLFESALKRNFPVRFYLSIYRAIFVSIDSSI